MAIPTHLGHKPIIGVDDYDDNDAQALSIGLAQWENETNDISAKVFRHNGDRWSPQSEELPLPRVIDLSILAIASFLVDSEQTSSITNLNEIIVNKDQIEIIRQYHLNNERTLRSQIIELRRIIDIYLQG